MILGLLAAAAVAASGDGTPPGFKHADWYRQPTREELRSAWPRKALHRGESGGAVLGCLVNIHGVAEDCRVLSETPQGQGFGAAALAMTPQFLFRPATQDGVPVPSRISLPVNFSGAGEGLGGGGPDDSVTLINRPVWTSAPGFADVAAVYPRPPGQGSGYVVLDCGVEKSGDLRDCTVITEQPQDKGFGNAAKRLIAKFQLAPDPDAVAVGRPLRVNVPIRLLDPKDADFLNRRIGDPFGTAGLDPNAVQKLFPPEAVKKGLKTGRGVARCTVNAQGALTNCSPLPGDPDGIGFSEAAVLVAQAMKMNPWTKDGGPVDGATLQLPIRFNLAERPVAK